MLQQDQPKDYVIATGEAYTVRDMCNTAFGYLDMPLTWDGYKADYNGNLVVETDSKYIRPAEVDHLPGDPSKAKQELGWQPKYDFDSLVKEMIDHDRLDKPI